MRVISTIFGIVAAILLILSPAIEQHFARTRPQKIDVQSGRVYEIHARGGTIVYLNKTEYLVKTFVFYGGVLSAIICGGLVAARRNKQNSIKLIKRD